MTSRVFKFHCSKSVEDDLKNGYEVFRSVQISSFILSKPCLQMAIEVHHICNIFTYIQSLNEHS